VFLGEEVAVIVAEVSQAYFCRKTPFPVFDEVGGKRPEVRADERLLETSDARWFLEESPQPSAP
jgi:hypothetical protein